MIERLFVFEEDGILLLKKNYSQGKFTEIEGEDLVSGFFSVMFQYFSRNFGKINIIKTDDKIICINHVAGAYVALVSTRYDAKSFNRMGNTAYFAKYEEVWNTNSRLEEITCRVLGTISRRMEGRTTKDESGNIRQFRNMENFQMLRPQIDGIIHRGNRQIKSIREITDKKMALINQIYH